MLSLSAEQEMVVSSLEELAQNEFSDAAFSWDGDIPLENIELLADRGYLGLNISEEYGGGGMGEFEAMLSIEAVGQVCPDTAEYLYNQQMVAPRGIEMFGSDTVKDRYLPGVTAGEDAIAIAISEPEAGSDVGAMSTTVEEENGELVLNGEKVWVSNIPHASACVVWARFPDGLGSVIIDLDDNEDSVEIEQHYTNMANHTQTQFRMHDIVVPETHVLTRGKDGFKQQLQALNWERLGSATLSNAIGRCAPRQGAGVRPTARTVRSADRGFPGHRVEARRYGQGTRGRRARSRTGRRSTRKSRDGSPIGWTRRWRSSTRGNGRNGGQRIAADPRCKRLSAGTRVGVPPPTRARSPARGGDRRNPEESDRGGPQTGRPPSLT